VPGWAARCGCLVVLTVAKIAGSGAAAYGQYLEGRTVAAEAGDYYLAADGERVEAPGRWALGAQGAETLGVDAAGPVAAEQFQALMAVQNPATGERLRAGGAGGSAVAAIDATFSAPKSVSVVWALASPQLRAGIEAAQERAVDAALAHATEYVPMVRRRVDRSTVLRETPAELIASSWRHTTARAVAGRAPDPQLHSHVVLHGAVRSDGRVVAIESRAWLVHQRELGAAYRAQLATELSALGFQVQAGTGRGGRYFELSGVPQGLLEAWSGRHQQVRQAIDRRLSERVLELQGRVEVGGSGADAAAERLAALERSGQLLPAEQRAVAMSTRAAKGEGGLQTAGDLDQAWWQAAQEHDFDARGVQALQVHGPVVELGDGELDRRILERLTEFDATFAPREARAVALEAVAGGDPAAGLAALSRLHERREILELADGRQTTRSHRRMERVAVAAAGGLADGEAVAIPAPFVDAEVAALQAELAASGGELADEQQRAIRVACSDRRLVVIVGQAGTGKSTALTGVARAHQAAGQRLIVTSTGAQAAQRLVSELADAGVAADGYSTAALRAVVAREVVTLGPGVTVVHDEAALASTREQAWLLDATASWGARVIEVGDPRQSQAVGAGGLWPQIEQAASERGGLVQLSRIVRAKDAADRRDQALWRAGEHQRSLAGYATRGRVVVHDTQQQAQDRALEAAHTDRREGKSALVLAQTSNEQLDELNARAQALRIQDGDLAGDRAVALANRPYGLYVGDEIVLRAASVHPQLGAVRNGTRGTVLDVDADGQSATVALSDGRQAIWERGQLDAGSARLSYVSHTFPAQGQTVDRAHVLAEPLADSNGTYVALTRAREHTHLYASAERLDAIAAGVEDGGGREARLVALGEQLGRSESEVPSIAVALAHEQHVEAEHAHQSDAQPPRDQARAQVKQALAERDQARARLDQARVQRRETAAVIATQPADQRVELARADAQRAGEQAQRAVLRAEQLNGELGDVGRVARLGQRGRSLRGQISAARGRERVALVDQRRHSQEADALQAELDHAQRAWQARHPGARDRHQAAEREHQVAEQAHQAAEQAYEIAVTHELLAASRPPPGAQPRLQQLRQEHARLKALGQQADQARLAQIRSELARLTQPSAMPRPPRRSGPTLGR